MKTKHKILIGIGVASVLGIGSYLLLKKKKATPVKKASDKTSATKTAADTGTLVNNSWDDAGGYYYQFADGSQDYYRYDDTFVKSMDKNGNMRILAEYNEWDDMHGYRYVFSDGSSDYYRKDGTFDHSGSSGYLTSAPFGTDSNGNPIKD